MPNDKKVITAEVNNSFWYEKTHDTAAVTYASTDCIGTLQYLETHGHGGGGWIDQINVIAKESQTPALRIWFFRRQPSEFVDSDTLTLLLNDLRKVAKYVDVAASQYVPHGANAIACIENANVKYSCPDGRLYYYVEARGASTFTGTGGLVFGFEDWPD